MKKIILFLAISSYLSSFGQQNSNSNYWQQHVDYTSREKPTGEKVSFSELSVSGRVVNAYNALKMADYMVNGK